jgi:Holliday junction resolvase RusA-like endonuclease
VDVHFRYPDKRRRDLFNFAAACKQYLDGLCDAGVYRDDSGIVWGTLSCEVDREAPGVTITVTEMA